MSSLPQSAGDELATVLRENQALKQSVAECEAAQRKAEQEAERGRAAAKAANEELQHFVYAASHDLQEPLRSISTYTQLLHRDYAKDAQAGELAAFIIDGVNQMNALIRDLLTYSRTGTVSKKTTVNLASTIQWAMFKLSNPIKESGAQVSCSDLPEVSIDDAQIALVFENLLSNSIKFRSSETPRIDITSEQKQDDAYTISVRDNGVGIESPFHDQVFLPFKRLHGKHIPGTGLGLAICRKIVGAHGGRIWVESDGKLGSTFKFTLPV
jgi:light-regulated signal transduction histidine kinase (bacteriophytochrome)